jgi:hypothetical protein
VQPVEPIRTLRYRVSGLGDCTVLEEGDVLLRSARTEDLVHTILWRCAQRSLHLLGLGGWSLVRGVVARAGRRRLLVAGAPGCGKTTLALRLLYDGWEVEGDGDALIRNDQIVALPRRFKLPHDVERFVPEMAAVTSGLPPLPREAGGARGFDPGEAGFPWILEAGPVDGVVVAESNRGGRTSIEEIAPFDMLRRLLSHTAGLDSSPPGRARLAGACARLVARGGYCLRLGDPAHAARALANLLKAVGPSNQPA